MREVAIIDYGVGNLLSLKRAFEAIDAEAIITNNPKKIINSSYVILPGVGAFKNAMKFINQLGLFDVIKQVAEKLHHTPEVCKKNYIYTELIEFYKKDKNKFNKFFESNIHKRFTEFLKGHY